MSDWEARMAERAKARLEAKLSAEWQAAGLPMSPEECWAADPSACRECCEPRANPHHGWMLWMVCDRQICTHKHHEADGPAIGAAS